MIPAISKKFIIIKRRRAGLLNWLSANQRQRWVHAWGSAPPGSLPRWSPFATGSIRVGVNRVPGRPRLGGALALGLARDGGLGSLRRSLRTGAGTWARRGGAVPCGGYRAARPLGPRTAPSDHGLCPSGAGRGAHPRVLCPGFGGGVSRGPGGSRRARMELARAGSRSRILPCRTPAAPPVPCLGAGTRARPRERRAGGGLGRLAWLPLGLCLACGMLGCPPLFAFLSPALRPASRPLSHRPCYSDF